MGGRQFDLWPLCYSNTFEVAWQSAQRWIGVLTTLDISENTDKTHGRFIDWPKRGEMASHGANNTSNECNKVAGKMCQCVKKINNLKHHEYLKDKQLFKKVGIYHDKDL